MDDWRESTLVLADTRNGCLTPPLSILLLYKRAKALTPCSKGWTTLNRGIPSRACTYPRTPRSALFRRVHHFQRAPVLCLQVKVTASKLRAGHVLLLDTDVRYNVDHIHDAFAWGAALLYLSLMLESSVSTFRASLETTVHSLSIDYVVGRDNLPTCPPFQFQR